MSGIRKPASRTCALLLGMALLSGCAGFQLEKARDVAPAGGDFNVTLYKEYIRLSALEYDEGDYRDSDAFARRAIAAAAGSPTAPEALEKRELPADFREELASARRELVAILEAASVRTGTGAARAQTGFECWMQEQEENFQQDDIAACKAGYMAAMESIRLALAPAPAAGTTEDGALKAGQQASPAPSASSAPSQSRPSPVPSPTPSPLPPASTYMVNFAFDSAEITPAGHAVIISAAAAVDAAGEVRIVVISGYTDRAGAKSYNTRLAGRRAQAVLDALKGHTRTDITAKTRIRVYGEDNNLVKTGDGVRKAENRRVTIRVVP